MYRLAFTLILAAIAFAAGWQVRHITAQRDLARHDAASAQALADAVRNARAVEQSLSVSLTEIGGQHAAAQHHADAVEAAVIAELTAGTVRLRREWQHCETRRVSHLAAATAERDAATADRDALAAALVRAGHDADTQLAACQAVIRAYREATTP